MAACVLSVGCPASDAPVRSTREITDRTAHPTADADEFSTSRNLRDLRIAQEVAAAACSAKPASLAEFAHDLCSPLSAIAIVARGLRVAGYSDNWDEGIDTIIHASEHVLGMVREVLDRASIEGGHEVPLIATCDLQELARDVMEMSRPHAQGKNLDLLVRRDGACPRYVRTDASWLRRILISVLDNAVKYTPGGSVTLSLHSAESHDPELVWLIVEIRDTGIGIAREDQTRIFQRFVRGSGAAGSNGAGLGLAIAYELVELLGGTILVESVPGTGSTFRIELPVERAQKNE